MLFSSLPIVKSPPEAPGFLHHRPFRYKQHPRASFQGEEKNTPSDAGKVISSVTGTTLSTKKNYPKQKIIIKISKRLRCLKSRKMTKTKSAKHL